MGFALGLPHHYWYLFLDRLIPGTSMRCVAKKILLDQSCFSPFANYVFFTGSGLLEGNSYKDSWKEFKEKFPMVYKVPYSSLLNLRHQVILHYLSSLEFQLLLCDEVVLS